MWVTPSLHWLMFKERVWQNTIEVVLRFIYLGFVVTVLVNTYFYTFDNNLIMWQAYFYAKAPIMLLLTVTEVWLRNDRDVIQGYSKVDNLVVVSVFQRLKSANKPVPQGLSLPPTGENTERFANENYSAKFDMLLLA